MTEPLAGSNLALIVSLQTTRMNATSVERDHETCAMAGNASGERLAVSHETALMQLDAGSGLDPDHIALAQLLDELESLCTGTRDPEGRCDGCPEKTIHACKGRLEDVCSRMQTLLLDHFQREQELMAALPASIAARTHCERHRQEHVNFSTRYNLAAVRLDASQPATGARELEALVFDWIRSHALTFDAELLAILGRAVDDRRCYA